jgi:hypothetical protein
VEVIAIPGRQALGAVVDVFLGNIDPAGHGVGTADPVSSSPFGHGIAESDDPGARRHSVFGIDAGEFARRGAVGEGKAQAYGRPRNAPPEPPNLRAESPFAPITIAPMAAQSGHSPAFHAIRPTSASTSEDIATGTRRKWGEGFRGEPMVTRASRGFAGENRGFTAPF